MVKPFVNTLQWAKMIISAGSSVDVFDVVFLVRIASVIVISGV